MCHDVSHCKSLVDFGLATLKIVSQVRQILEALTKIIKPATGLDRVKRR